MKRFMVSLGWLCAFGGVITLTLFVQPSRASAGGLPCFVCHGVNFEGSDLAPTLAGTRLTDEQIIKQVHNPRGVMPAFDGLPWSDQDIVKMIRAQPTGQPTLSLSPQQRSEALATIAAVAARRATAVLPTPLPPTATVTPRPTATIVPSITPRPSLPVATATTTTASASSAAASTPSTDSAVNVFMLIGGLLVVGVAVVWIWQRR